MIELTRATNAMVINAIVNHESIYPLMRGAIEGEIDLSPIVANPNNHVMIAEHGAAVFTGRQIGLFEMTLTVLPAGRGDWALKMAREALDWLFTHTNAVEVYLRAPAADAGAEPFAAALGFAREFTAPRGWIYNGAPSPAAIVSLQIQTWLRQARGLGDAAESFHASMGREFARAGHAPYARSADDVRDRYLGAMIRMIEGGQAQKGVIFYDRFAAMMGYPPVALVGVDPIVIIIDGLEFEAHGRNFFMVAAASGTLN